MYKLYIIIVRFISNLTTHSFCRRFDLVLFYDYPVAVLVCRRFDHASFVAVLVSPF